ncbi:MAG: fluoride efflux transporter CrcB [Acidimicrobiaceae bacterium]|nr:fluoride efflux transporter CrcB [Acidimicrobiaceae bacterium]
MALTRTPTMRDLALVSVGGIIGAASRWSLVEATTSSNGEIAGSVLLANLIGCALLGVLTGRGLNPSTRLLLGAGFCGGLTTFSTFAVEVADALRSGDTSGGIGYALLSVVCGLAVFGLGRRTSQTIARTRSC